MLTKRKREGISGGGGRCIAVKLNTFATVGFDGPETTLKPRH
jgi:hypothetical protein